MSLHSLRRAAATALAFAAAALAAGCSHDDVRYPAGWPPLADTGGKCPDLKGSYRADAKDSQDPGLGGLASWQLANPTHRLAPPQILDISTNATQRRMDVRLAPAAIPGNLAGWHHHLVNLDKAPCDGGLVTIERHDTVDGWSALRLGKDVDGNIVAVHLVDGRRPLLTWGDTSALRLRHTTDAYWSRWLLAAPTANASPAAPPAPVAPTPPPGVMEIGQAQAMVLAALPDTAIFESMVPTPDGYRVHVRSKDPKAAAQLTERLVEEGHFEVHPDAAAGSGITLELVERVPR